MTFPIFSTIVRTQTKVFTLRVPPYPLYCIREDFKVLEKAEHDVV